MAMNHHIKLVQVSATFLTEKEKTLHDITCELEHGRITALVGQSGSGKSVLGRTMMGFLEDAYIEGHIYYKGYDLLQLRESDFRKMRGQDLFFIPQDPQGSLNPSMKIGKQLIEGLAFHYGCTEESGKEKSISMLSQLGLHDGERVFYAYPHELSGGMLQRVLVAMACLLEPKWIIMDEPTKGLDPMSRMETIDLIERVRRRSGVGILLITHDMRFVKALADHIIILKSGRLHGEGTFKDLIESSEDAYIKGMGCF